MQIQEKKVNSKEKEKLWLRMQQEKLEYKSEVQKMLEIYSKDRKVFNNKLAKGLLKMRSSLSFVGRSTTLSSYQDSSGSSNNSGIDRVSSAVDFEI